MIHEFQENLSIVSRGLRLDSGYAGDVNRTGDGWGDAGNSFVIDIRTGDGVGESIDMLDPLDARGDGYGFGVATGYLDGNGAGEGL